MCDIYLSMLVIDQKVTNISLTFTKYLFIQRKDLFIGLFKHLLTVFEFHLSYLFGYQREKNSILHEC